MLFEDGKEPVDLVKPVPERFIILTAGKHRPARHEEAGFRVKMHVAGQISCVGRVPYFEERILFAAVGDDRHVRIHTACGEERCVRASRDVDHAVLPGLDHAAELFLDLFCIQQTDGHDRDLDGTAAVLEIFSEGFRQHICRFDLRRTEDDKFLRAKYFRSEDVLDGALVIEFNNRFHGSPGSFFSDRSYLTVLPAKAAESSLRSRYYPYYYIHRLPSARIFRLSPDSVFSKFRFF